MVLVGCVSAAPAPPGDVEGSLGSALPVHAPEYTPPTLSKNQACPSIETNPNGWIQGGSSKAYPDLCAYWGIPYAGDTSDHRWMKAPAPPSGATQGDPYSALDFGPWCPQIHTCTETTGACQEGKKIAVGSEDCLRLNVWSPNPEAGAKLPVMVYIHGGAFIRGASDVASGSGPFPQSQNLFEGGFIASEHDVVVVSLNYRLGALGFLASNVHDVDGNYGFMDQQMALEWISKNVEQFGGDPSKVTIWGESAGAMSVGLHMVSAPSSYNSGNFQAGIMESNLPGLPYKNLKKGQADEDFKKYLKQYERAALRTCLLQPSFIECLRKGTLEQLMTAQKKAGTTHKAGEWDHNLHWTPVIDGDLLLRQPLDGTFHQPAIFGTNANEGLYFSALLYDIYYLEGYEKVVQGLFPDHSSQVLSKYPKKKTAFENGQQMAKIFTDYIFTCPNDEWAERNSKHGGSDLYGYLFNQASAPGHYFDAALPKTCSGKVPHGGNALLCQCYSLEKRPTAEPAVCHGAELAYVFNSPGYSTLCGGHHEKPCDMDAGQQDLSRYMAKAWTDFAKTHVPNTEWPKYASERQYLPLPANLEPSTVPESAHCDMWDDIGYPPAWLLVETFHGSWQGVGH